MALPNSRPVSAVSSCIRARALDTYTTFGSAFSPSLAMALPVRPRVKWRASVGRAFRVPTFTERFYTDPNHRANDALAPERGWTADTGVDTYLGGTWVGTVTGFVRRERDVIDWVRPDPTVRWRTENIRDVRSHGFETFVRGQQGPVSLGAQYTYTRVETDRLAGLSKYVDDYAPHGVGADLGLQLPWALSTGARLEHRRPGARPGPRSTCASPGRSAGSRCSSRWPTWATSATKRSGASRCRGGGRGQGFR